MHERKGRKASAPGMSRWGERDVRVVMGDADIATPNGNVGAQL